MLGSYVSYCWFLWSVQWQGVAGKDTLRIRIRPPEALWLFPVVGPATTLCNGGRPLHSHCADCNAPQRCASQCWTAQLLTQRSGWSSCRVCTSRSESVFGLRSLSMEILGVMSSANSGHSLHAFTHSPLHLSTSIPNACASTEKELCRIRNDYNPPENRKLPFISRLWLRGVVVITSALHAAGHGFDPHRDQFSFWFSPPY